MDEAPRLLLMLLFAGAALTVAGAVGARLNDEARRIRRGLRKILGAAPHELIVARGTGRGAGFDFGAGRMAVAWDAGAWGLVYRLEELIGAELILDGQVAARAHRGEARRALDVVGGAETEVRLRLIFDDPRYADFDLVLWTEDAKGVGADDAAQEGNRWIARTEALLRKPAPRREPVPVAARPAGPDLFAALPAAADEPDEDDEDSDDIPPWEDDPEPDHIT